MKSIKTLLVGRTIAPALRPLNPEECKAVAGGAVSRPPRPTINPGKPGQVH